MGYLYGDLTPFPHNVNYIELIREAIETCRVLLQIDASMGQCRRAMEAERASISNTVAEFRQMAAVMADAVQPYLARQDSPVIKQVSNRLFQSIRDVLEGAQSSLQSHHESNASATEAKVRAEREQALPALERLLIRHELPGTVWMVHWSSGQVESQAAEAQALAKTPFGLEGSFRLEVPTSLAWVSTIRVADVKQHVLIQLPKKARRGAVSKSCELDRYNIIEAALGHQVTRLVLRKTLRPGVPGLELNWQGSALSIRPLDDDTFPDEPILLEESDAAVAADLRERVEAQLWSLVDKRVRLVQAKFGGSEVQQLDSPAPLVRVVIKSIAPFCREIIRRTQVNGELSLKRVVEDHRREEIFIKASDLTKIYASLPPSHQAFFDELGLPAATAAAAAAAASAAPAATAAVPDSSVVVEMDSAEDPGDGQYE